MSLEFEIDFLDTLPGTAVRVAGLGWNPVLGVRARGETISAYGIHDALTDQADWNAPTWALDMSKLTGLNELVRSAYDESAAGISVSALWAGTRATETAAVTIDELCNLIDRSKLGTHTTYLVQKKP